MADHSSEQGLRTAPGGRSDLSVSDGHWRVQPRLQQTARPTAVSGIETAFAEWDRLPAHPGIVPLEDWSPELSYTVPAPAYGTLTRHLDRSDAVVWIDEAVTLTQTLCDAVETAHTAGLTHGALDPASVYLYRGESKRYRPAIADWGLAARLDASPSAVWGQSINVVAPEQLRGTAPDARTDCYQLGALCYRLLTGAMPFPGDRFAVAGAVGRVPPVAPSERAPAVPDTLDEPVLRALAIDPADRYDSVGAFAAALAAVDSEPAVAASGVTDRPPVAHWRHVDSLRFPSDSQSSTANGETARDRPFVTEPDLSWEHRTDGAVDGPLAFAHDTVIAASSGGSVTALNATTGDCRWVADLDTQGTPAVAAGGGRVVIADARTLTARAVRSGDTCWERPIGGVSAPVIVSGRTETARWGPPADPAVLIGCTDGSVYALDAASGETCWQTELDATICTAPAVSETTDTAYFGSVNSGVLAVGRDGTDRFRYRTESRVVGPPAVADDHVYVTEKNGAVHGIDRSDGGYMWHTTLPGQCHGRPHVAGETVFVGTGSTGRGHLCALDSVSGEGAWKCSLGACVTTGPRPTPAGGAVLIGTKTGLHGVDPRTGNERYRTETAAPVGAGPVLAVRGGEATTVYVGGRDYLVTAFQGGCQ